MYWKTNALRSLVLLVTIIVVIFVAHALDKFTSIVGAVFGLTNVLLLPGICHLKLVAETPCQKAFDIFVIVLATFMLIFGPATIMM